MRVWLIQGALEEEEESGKIFWKDLQPRFPYGFEMSSILLLRLPLSHFSSCAVDRVLHCKKSVQHWPVVPLHPVHCPLPPGENLTPTVSLVCVCALKSAAAGLTKHRSTPHSCVCVRGIK